MELTTLLVLLPSVLGFATALVGLLLKLRKQVQEIHVLVNSRLSEALARIDQLDEILRNAGIVSPEVPE